MSEALGISRPAPLPRLEGETDQEYGVRIARQAMAFCATGERKLKPPPTLYPRFHPPPEAPPEAGKAEKADNPLSGLPDPPEAEPEERLASWPDEPITEEAEP